MKRIFLFILILCQSSYVVAADDNEIVSIGNLRKSFFDAVHKKKTEDALQALARLHLLVYADWLSLTDDQAEAWKDLSKRYACKVQGLTDGDVSARLRDKKKTEAPWLLEKIKKNQYKIDWPVLLGDGDPLVSQDRAHAHRIEALKDVSSSLNKYMGKSLRNDLMRQYRN